MVADPTTAIQVAGVAVQFSKSIFTACNAVYTFFHDVNRVGETAREFASEIQALKATGELVNTQVRELANEQAKYAQDDEETNTLFKVLVQRLSDCDRTTQQLKAAVSSVEAASGEETNYFQQAICQLKLNTKAAEIEEVRNRIRMHTSALNLAFQAINLKVSRLIPNLVDAHLRALLDKVECHMRDFKTELAMRPISNSGDLDSNEETLLNTSSKVLSSGRTLYGGSVLGSSVRHTSIFGHSARINDWVRVTGDIEELASRCSAADTRPSSVFSGANNERRPSGLSDDIATASRPTELSRDMPLEEDVDAFSDDSYSEEELDVDAAKHAIKMGKSAFDAKDHAQASEILQEALMIIKILPRKRQAIHDGCDIRYMLGICSYYLYEPAIAEEALLAIIENQPRTRDQDNTRSHYVLDAGHLLALTYVKLGKLDQARSVCNSTLKGRAKLFSKKSESYIESLALMARIAELQGNTSRAKVYADMLPSDKAETLAERFQELHVIDESRSSGTNKPAVPVLPTAFAADRVLSVETDLEPATAQPSDHEQILGTPANDRGSEYAASSLDTRCNSNAVASNTQVSSSNSLHLSSAADKEINVLSPAIMPMPSDVASEKIIETEGVSSIPTYHRAAASDSAIINKCVNALPKPSSATRLAALIAQRNYVGPPIADVASRQRLLGLLDGDSSSLFKEDAKSTDQRKILLKALVHNNNPIEVAKQQYAKLARPSLTQRTFKMMVSDSLYVWQSHLHLASLFGDYEVVKFLLSAGAKVDSTCVPGFTALHLAALAGHRNIVDLLLNGGARPDRSMDGLGTPLFLAVAGRRLEVIDLLLRHGAKLDGTYVGLGTVAHVACATGDLDFVHALYGDTCKRESLTGSKRTGNNHTRTAEVWSTGSMISTARVRELLQLSRTDPAEQFLAQKSRFSLIPELSNVTPLALAAYVGAAQVVEFLIVRRLDPGVQCLILSADTREQHSSALDLACRSGHQEVVAILLSHVSPARIPSNKLLDRSYDPSNELSAATLNGHAACVATLLDYGMRIWLMLLMQTIRGGREHIVQVFIDHGLSVELAACALRDLPMPKVATAVSDAEKRCWQRLIAGVDGIATFSWPDQSRIKHGGTLLHTIKEKHAFAVPYFIEAHADIEAVNTKGDTPLIVAVKNQNVAVIHELLKGVASKNIRNNAKCCAIDLALESKNMAIVRMFIDPGEPVI